jgi:sulfonate transport system ATP-binding protein
VINLKDISYSFSDRKVLNKLNLTINEKSFQSLVGQSGSGKTLILKLISKLIPLQYGVIAGCPKNISFVFQDSSFFPWLTINKNLEICTGSTFAEINESLNHFRLQSYGEMYPFQLSGGSLQKVNILRSFLKKADLILMDEPFVHLDMAQKEDLYAFTLKLWQSYRPTILLVTHDLDEAIFLSEKISCLSKKTKNIIQEFSINFEKSTSFHESKILPAHLAHFQSIYSNLKEDLK